MHCVLKQRLDLDHWAASVLEQMIDLICQKGFLDTIFPNIKPRCCLTVNVKYNFPPAFCGSINTDTPILAEAKQLSY